MLFSSSLIFHQQTDAGVQVSKGQLQQYVQWEQHVLVRYLLHCPGEQALSKALISFPNHTNEFWL